MYALINTKEKMDNKREKINKKIKKVCGRKRNIWYNLR